MRFLCDRAGSVYRAQRNNFSRPLRHGLSQRMFGAINGMMLDMLAAVARKGLRRPPPTPP